MRTINSLITSAFNTKHIYVYNDHQMTGDDTDETDDNDDNSDIGEECNSEDGCEETKFERIATKASVK